MANPSDTDPGRSLMLKSEADVLEALRTEFNKFVTNFRVLTAKLDADVLVNNTNYALLITDASASGPAKVVPTVG